MPCEAPVTIAVPLLVMSGLVVRDVGARCQAFSSYRRGSCASPRGEARRLLLRQPGHSNAAGLQEYVHAPLPRGLSTESQPVPWRIAILKQAPAKRGPESR